MRALRKSLPEPSSPNLALPVRRLSRLTRWERWPPVLQALISTLYPAYLVWNAAKRVRSSDRLDDTTQRRLVALLAAACLAATLHGSKKRAKTA